MNELKKIPGVDTLMNRPEIQKLVQHTEADLVKYVIREVLQETKEQAASGMAVPHSTDLAQRIVARCQKIAAGHLKKVINATGVVIHTNLGRAPFGKAVLQDVFAILHGYNNLEFDLEKATRGSRYAHASDLLKYLSGAQDVLVVNNNAAAVVLMLRTLASGREVIISRGELIEIGGSFRMPDIIATSGCRMVEVGTTNKTKLRDYEQAITTNTGVLFKAHKSNYSIDGFTQEVTLKELAALGKKHNLPVVYDMGSGLLKTDAGNRLNEEPIVREILKQGADLVSFSGDKLLGGPQAGIIAGKKQFVQKLKKDPLLRALRVDKLTLAFLERSLIYFLNEKELHSKNPVYQTINQSKEKLHGKAVHFQKLLEGLGVEAVLVESSGQFGGGSMPGKRVPGYAVKVNIGLPSARQRAGAAERIYRQLLSGNIPVLGILRKGAVCFDVLTLADEEIAYTAQAVAEVFHQSIKS